jgi:NTE family protein
MAMLMASCIGHEVEGQSVLVLQGGGALGAYQAGVYQALHEAGQEPDWIIGTSIGAINAALIAGNRAEERSTRLQEFWDRVRLSGLIEPMGGPWAKHWYANFATTVCGIPGFFTPRAIPFGGIYAPLGVYAASWYRTEALAETLGGLIDRELLAHGPMRLTVGAVAVTRGEMEYFDNRDRRYRLELNHILASGALPPAFPAIRVGEEPYWDGGIYSNTPIEAVMADYPRKDSVIFNVNVWHAQGAAPKSIWQVLGRQKNIQYASRSESHLAQQKQLHRMRHIIRHLKHHLPPQAQEDPTIADLASHGCGTTMHVVRLLAPEFDGDDYTKDIDFTPSGITERHKAGYEDARAMLARAPWRKPVDPLEGIIVHQDMPMTERLAKS